MVRNASAMAVSSVLADYYDPLFDRYKVFGKESKEKLQSGRKDFVKGEFTKFLEKNLPEANGLFSPGEVQVKVTDCVALTDYKGAFFRQQAVEYMEYRGAPFVVENILEALGVFGETSAVTAILQEEEEVAESLEEIDRTILKLMQVIDGVKIDNDGVKLGWTGKIKTVDKFVKKMVPGPLSSEAVSVGSAELFEALKSKYEDPSIYVSDMYDAAVGFIENGKKIAANEAEVAALKAEEEALPDGGAGRRAAIKARILLLEAENTLIEGKRLINKAGYTSAKSKLEKLVSVCKEAAEEALSLLGVIKERQESAKPEVYHYLETLAEAQGKIDNDMLEGLLENALLFQEYIGDIPSGTERLPDLDTFSKTLGKDLEVLKKAKAFLENHETPDSFETADDRELLKVLSEYRFEGLLFDYTGLKLKAAAFDPFKSIKSLIENGILGLVVKDPGEISDLALTGADLPSKTLGITAESNDGSSFFTDIGGLLLASPVEAISELLKTGASELAEDTLFIAYLFDNFGCYTGETRENSRCRYELEYVLGGQLTDRENLGGVVLKILALRTLMCTIHILTSREKTAEAAAFAATVLGFTGMPVLIKILQYSVILAWAYEEALVETAILMRGKRVPAVPAKNGFLLELPEVFAAGKSLIDAKADSYEGKTGLSYREYVVLLLLLQDEGKQSLRTLDIIQENLRLTDPGVLMTGMVYGFNIDAAFAISPVFPGVVGKNRQFIFEYTGGSRY
ncbi:MAG: hypothetical protein J6113_06740 [Lachnospiraceae bacterium]|nr:hypothetical protein [Lachnospiraceae bacterium]